MRLQHITIVRLEQDTDAMRSFYRDLVGLREKPVPTSLHHLNLIWFNIGEDAELHIMVEDTIDTVSNRHFCLAVDDIAPIRHKIERAGYVTWDVEEITGRPRFFSRDPSGNVLEFTMITDDYRKHQS
ncbi:MAG: VOC family protein [Phototrophicaceae bacterium]|jgi:catechol 2,3-dioxygenase-like lactoylglutathione lyase family enzyme